MTVNISLVLLVGVPASGKTTFCNKLLLNNYQKSSVFSTVDRGFRNHSLFIHVCFDSIIALEDQRKYAESAYTDSSAKQMKGARDSILKDVESLLEFLLNTEFSLLKLKDIVKCFGFTTSSCSPDCHIRNVVILMDDNFYYRSMRHQYYLLAFKHKVSFCQVFFECPLQKAIQYNSQRSQKIPSSVILKMHDRLQPPSSDISWEKLTLIFTASTRVFPIEEFQKLVLESLKFPADTVERELERSAKSEMKVLGRVSCSKSVLHQSDLILRDLVREYMQNTTEEKEKVARCANAARQRVLAQIKGEEGPLPSLFQEEFSDIIKEDLTSKLKELFVSELEQLLNK